MKVNFVETYDTMNFGDVALGDVFLDAEDENNKRVYIKIGSADFDDNAYNLTENFKVRFDRYESVFVLQAELNVSRIEAI